MLLPLRPRLGLAQELTVVSVSGPAEMPGPARAQLEGGLAALPQGSAILQGQGCMLRTPVGDEAMLLASAGDNRVACLWASLVHTVRPPITRKGAESHSDSVPMLHGPAVRAGTIG